MQILFLQGIRCETFQLVPWEFFEKSIILAIILKRWKLAIWKSDFSSKKGPPKLTLFVPTLLDSSRVAGGAGGGADLPTFELLPRDGNLIYFFSQSSCLGCKGPEYKSTTLYLENCSPDIFLKIHCFWQKSKFFWKFAIRKPNFFLKESPPKLNRGT